MQARALIEPRGTATPAESTAALFVVAAAAGIERGVIVSCSRTAAGELAHDFVRVVENLKRDVGGRRRREVVIDLRAGERILHSRAPAAGTSAAAARSTHGVARREEPRLAGRHAIVELMQRR